MKLKKYLIATLITLLIIDIFTIISPAKLIGRLSNNDDVNDTGVIQEINVGITCFKKPIYLINGDQGTMFLRKLYKKYYPLNLPEEVQKKDIKIEFTGDIQIKDILTVKGIISLLKYQALPIKIKDIKRINPDNEIDLDFDINIEPNYKIGEPITVIANLINLG